VVAEPPEAQLDDELLAAAVSGDQVAFAALYRDVQPRLRRYAWTLVGQEADDVTAEAWLQIARDIRQFVGDLDAFRGWTARIVRNRAFDHLRAAARRPAELTDVEAFLDSPTVDASSVALDRMSTVHALELIASLPRNQAEAVLLRAVVGLDSATAAEVLGKSPTAVRVAAHRGLKNLAKRLASDPAADTAARPL
jgi:RNA polymerase sigma-70 factor (ECF subfamily)